MRGGSLTRGSEYSYLTGEILVFWKSHCLQEVVAYERWSLTRGSEYSYLTGEILVFWKSRCLQEVVTYERWSHREVLLYLNQDTKHKHSRTLVVIFK